MSMLTDSTFFFFFFFKASFSGYPETWFSKFQEVTERGITRLSAVFVVFLDVLNFFAQT